MLYNCPRDVQFAFEVLFPKESLMRSFFVPSVAALAVLASSALAADIKSGLPVGGSAGFFEVKDCTGPNKGKTLCYR